VRSPRTLFAGASSNGYTIDLEDAMTNRIYVALDLPLARRVLTALELLGQQTTAERPEFDALRDAIRVALQEAMGPLADDREPIEREVL
jgi:hypothetical protein